MSGPVSAGGRVLDVDDVTGCPVASLCSVCGESGPALAVYALDLPVGVSCTTLCSSCVGDGRLPAIPSWAAAVGAVCAHCGHLGCDVDQMAAALEASR